MHWQMYQTASTDAGTCAAPCLAASCGNLQPSYSVTNTRIPGNMRRTIHQNQWDLVRGVVAPNWMTSVPLHPGPMRWIRVRMRSIVARQSMLSRRQQALRRQRKGGPENGTENRPEIGPAGQFHRQCVEPLRCPDCGVYRRPFFYLRKSRRPFHSRGNQCSAAFGLYSSITQ